MKPEELLLASRPQLYRYLEDSGFAAYCTATDDRLRKAASLVTADRAELQVYLEGRGFGVYDNEPLDQLRFAAIDDAQINEVEPRWSTYQIIRVALDLPCPDCTPGPDKRCRTRTGAALRPAHVSRMAAARAHLDAGGVA